MGYLVVLGGYYSGYFKGLLCVCNCVIEAFRLCFGCNVELFVEIVKDILVVSISYRNSTWISIPGIWK